jgi:hypothetical protein
MDVMPQEPSVYLDTILSDSTTNVNIGQFVIVRCEAAGVHCGILINVTGDTVTLSHSRRLWEWNAKGGIALSGLAVHGLDLTENNKIDSAVDNLMVRGWCEIIPAPGLLASLEN